MPLRPLPLRILFCLLAAQPASATAPVLLGEEPDAAILGVGEFAVIRGGRHRTTEGNAEFRLGEKLYGLGPAAGLMANREGGAMAYAGLYATAQIGDITLSPFAGAGAYHHGASKYLGGVFEFRLSLDAAYQFPNRSRAGIRLAHLSNAGLHPFNPGVEELQVVFSIPLD